MSDEIESSETLSELMATLDMQKDIIAESLVATNEKKAEIKRAIEEQQKLIRSMMDEVHAIDASTFDTQRELRRLENERASAQRRFQLALDNEHLKDAFAATSEEYDRIVAGAPWREFAMDHQIKGAKALAFAGRGILADKMGLGKTLTSLIWADMLQVKRLLIITPNDVMRNFEREVKRWAPHRRVMIIGGGVPKAVRNTLIDTLAHVEDFTVILNYEAWRKDMALIDNLAKLQFQALITDEAHSYKDRKTITFRGIERLVFAENWCPNCHANNVTNDPVNTWNKICGDCGHAFTEFFEACSLKYVLPMTGTPILNKPQDLFTMLSLIDRPNFSSEYNYLRDYCQQDPYSGKWYFQSGGLERLTKRMSERFVMRDRKAAGVVIPPQEEVIYNLDLDPEEYPEQYKAVRQLNQHHQIILDEMEGKAINMFYIIQLITRKRQMMTWPAGIEWRDSKTGELQFKVDVHESVKVDKCIKYTNGDFQEWDGLIPDLTNGGERNADGKWTGERVVVFSQFKAPLSEMHERCKKAGIESVIYTGDTDDATADEVKMDFDRYYVEQTDGPKYQVVFAHYKKGGIGLNFTDATQTIILDEEWNPGKRDQAYARTARVGQTQETTVHVLRVGNSIDTWLATLIAEKQDMISGFESSIDAKQMLLNMLKDDDVL